MLTLCYADDLCLYRQIKSQHDIMSLQNDVNTLVAAVDGLALKLNPNKCKYIIFSRKKSPASHSIHIKDRSIQQVPSLKYLGFTLTQDLSWTEHIKLVCSRARRRLGFIYRNFYRYTSNRDTLSTLYESYVRPILEYGALVWDPYLVKDTNMVESVQQFATKICLKDWNMPYLNRLQLLNLDSLVTRRKFSKLLFLFNMVHSISAPCFPLVPLRHGYDTRSHNLSFRTNHGHSNAYLNSYYNSTIYSAWNQLPTEVVSYNTGLAFKNMLYSLNLLPNFNF